ncbi:MAG: excinuclease ABC subunit UvrC, partial [Prevotella sp.]|nr:excinuclease ABC subunit UvrC [Prevotella sp.]
DGKTYPSICITNEPYPRIFKTRTINRHWGTYYGPYSNIGSMHAVLDIIKKLYHPRTCLQPITDEGVRADKYRPCLDYHIKNCGGVCCGRQSKEDYQNNIAQAREILRGNTRQIERELEQLMNRQAEELRFEEAEETKRRLMLVRQFVAKSEVVSHTIDNVDVFSITDDEQNRQAFINYIHVAKGQINQSFTFEYKKRLDETAEELLLLGIVEMRQRFQSTSREVVLPFSMELPLEGVSVTVPQRGDKKTLLELSEMNGRQYRVDRLKQAEKLNPEQRQMRLMKELQDKLHLPTLPMWVEAFDNSNISGQDAVAACVVFRQLKPSKKDYVRFNIKTVEGPDDYASMREVVRRRYSDLKQRAETAQRQPSSAADTTAGEQERNSTDDMRPYPDLIVADGGRGQMEVIRQVVNDELQLNIPIAGLAKDNRHRTNELLYGFPPVTIGLKQESELFHVLTQLQDEVHRFAISFHRDKRSKRQLHSALDDIKGIGPKTREALLDHFKTVKRIREATADELAAVVGQAKASVITAHFASETE